MPDILKEAIASETNSGLVWKTAENEHLSKDKMKIVSRSVGFVLMGFIHPEELSAEIRNETGVDSRIAANIAEPINKRIFQPLQDELEKIYAPASEEPQKIQPAMMDSISPLKIGDVPKPPTPSALASQIKQTIPPFAVPSPLPIPTPAIPKPIQTLDSSVPPVVSPSTGSMNSPQASSGQAKVEPPVVSKVEPFMLHQESEFKPSTQSAQNFKVGLSQEQFGKMEQKWTAPPKPAQIETGFVPQQNPEQSKPALNKVEGPALSRVEGSAARVVHYNEMKTPLPPKPAPAMPAPSRAEGPVPSRVEGLAPVPQKPAPVQPTPGFPGASLSSAKLPNKDKLPENMLAQKPKI